MAHTMSAVQSMANLNLSEDQSIPTTTDLDDIRDEEIFRLFEGNPRFRVLIIGRSNAGKTTLLERLGGSNIDQTITYRNGERIPYVFKSTATRGEHEIRDEIIFPTNPGFVFHDSRGFEFGGVDEAEYVWSFIEERAAQPKLGDKLHAIWVCIPLDNDRPLLTGEFEFFARGAGSVPVIVILTKKDGRMSMALSKLTTGKTRAERRDARRLNAPEAIRNTDAFIHDLETRLFAQPYRPASIISTGDMQKDNNESSDLCAQLLQRTEEALPSVILKLLLAVANHHDLKTLMGIVLRRFLRRGKHTWVSKGSNTLGDVHLMFGRIKWADWDRDRMRNDADDWDRLMRRADWDDALADRLDWDDADWDLDRRRRDDAWADLDALMREDYSRSWWKNACTPLLAEMERIITPASEFRDLTFACVILIIVQHIYDAKIDREANAINTIAQFRESGHFARVAVTIHQAIVDEFALEKAGWLGRRSDLKLKGKEDGDVVAKLLEIIEKNLQV